MNSDSINLILSKLKERNCQETHPFTEILTDHFDIFDKVETLKAKNSHLQLTNDKLKLEVENLQEQIVDGVGDKKSVEKISELEKKLYETQAELTGFLSEKATNAQKLIDLNDLLRNAEHQLSEKTRIIDNLKAEYGVLEKIRSDLALDIEELRKQNEMLENAKLEFELQLRVSEDKRLKSEEENKRLLTQYIKFKQTVADKFNMENEMYFRKKEDQFQRQLADASKEPSNISESSTYCYEPILASSLPSKSLFAFDAHEGEVTCVKNYDDGRFIATAGNDRKVKLWEMKGDSCQNKAILTGCNAGITCLDFDRQQRFIMASSNDFSSRIWSLKDHRLKHSLTGHNNYVMTSRFLGEDGGKAVTGSHDRTVKIWDLHKSV